MSKQTKVSKVLAGPGGDELKIEWRDPNELIPYEKNTKIHSASQISQIAGQISAFGFDVPIVVTKKGIIIKGHGRREAALQLGLKKVPVIITSLDEKQARASRIGDNKVSESPWDQDALKLEFEALQAMDYVALTGFNENEIQSVLMEWETDLKKVENTKEHLDGIFSIIKIRCSKEMRQTLKDFILTRIAEQGFEDVEVE